MSEYRDNVSGHRFNDDLLLTESDRTAAARAYPKYIFALDFASLRGQFKKIDKEANNAKARSRRLGLVALSLGVIGWFLASAEPGYDSLQSPWKEVILFTSALLGVMSVVMGMRGVLFSSAKLAWIKNRFLTERIRQFHFQNLLMRLPELVVATRSDDLKHQFVLESNARFEAFKMRFLDHTSAEFDQCVNDNKSMPDWLLPAADGTSVSLLGPELEEFFQAYRDLRFTHQINYAWHKIRDPLSLWDFPARQQERTFSLVALSATAVLFVANLAQAAAISAGLQIRVHPWDYIVTIWVAIIALAIRALEEGLQPQREVERYENYLASCSLKRERFDTAKSLAEKFVVMLDFERTSYEEMRLFLKDTLSARFVI